MEVVFFKGHHGTSSENSKKIRESNFLCKSGWFGTGAYFFDDDSEMARSWARYKYKGRRIDVIECEIEVKKDKLLDLCNPKSENNKMFHLFRDRFLSDISKKLVNIKDYEEELDCKIIDYLIKKDDLDVIRNASYTYTEKDREYNKIGSKVANAYEICVANLECIKSKK